ncbi:MAG: Gldg family protein [Spirochaetales bacterium]|nr:Gldg family protein [Spirochaetales bacterium]
MVLLTVMLILLPLLIIWHAGLWNIFEKVKKPWWASLIPVYNTIEILDIIGLPWWTVFFLYVPLLAVIPWLIGWGVVFLFIPLLAVIPWVIVSLELGACFKQSRLVSFFLLGCFPFIGYPILGFGGVRYFPPVNVARTERVFSKFLKFTIYFAIIVLINIISVQYFLRIDLTAIKMYSLSRASRQAVKTLQEPLTVRVFFSSDLPGDYLDLQQYIEDLLEEYAVHGGRNFSFRFYDVGGTGELSPVQETNRELANDYGIYPVKIQILENDALTYREAYMGMAIIHGDLIETLTQITSREKLEYDITTTIQKMNNKISALLALDDRIKVKLFLSSAFFNLLETLSDIPDQVEKIVEQLNKENYNKLEYIQIDPSREPLSPEDEALDPRYFISRSQDGTGEVRLYADIIIQYADKIEKYNFLEIYRTPFGSHPQIANEETIKEAISNTVTNIIDINEYIGYLADHGTARLQWDEYELQAYAQANPGQDVRKITADTLKEILTEHHTLKEIKLGEGENIPKGIECLVIAGPKDVFSDWELFQIDQFLMEGKSLAIFLDGLKEETPQMNRQLYGYNVPKEYPAVKTGLEFLLERYGVTVKNSYVYDQECFETSDRKYGDLKIYYFPLIQNEFINEKLLYMRNIRGLLMIQASPIKLYEETLKTNDIKADILFSSSNKSWEVSEHISLDNPLTIMPPESKEDMQSYPLAVALEGQFPSYFKDKPIPQKPKKEIEEPEGEEAAESEAFSEEVTDQIKVIEKAESPGRIILIGTSEIIRDYLLSYDPTPQNPSDIPPNRALVSNVIDYCNGKEDYAAMRSKLQLINPLDESKITPFIKDFTTFFNIIGIPVLVAFLGIIVFILRNAQRKNLQLKFSKKGTATHAVPLKEEPVSAEVSRAGIKRLKFTKDYLTLIIIIAVLFGTLIWINVSRSLGVIRYKLPKLTMVDEKKIDKIAFTNKKGTFTLEKDKDDKWHIMPEGFPVDPAHTNAMLDNLSDIEISELISEQKQYDRYELDDENKIHVQAFIDDTLVRELDIGKPSSSSSHTYVTLKGDPNIYSVKNNLQQLFDKDNDSLRDEKVLSYPKNEITELVLEFDSQMITITKQLKELDEEGAATGEELWFSDAVKGPVRKRSIDDILNTMGNLVCEEYYTDRQKSDMENEPFLYRITARGKKDYALTIFDHPGDNKYPAYSSESEYAFKLIGWRATKMMKKLDDLNEEDTEN